MNKKLKIFLFSSSNYTYYILNFLIRNKNVKISGICLDEAFLKSKINLKSSIKNFLGKAGMDFKDDFFYKDPFTFEKRELRFLLKNLDNVINYNKENLEDLESNLIKIKPDIILVAGFFILPEFIFQKSRIISVNLHPSFLPEGRGPTPSKWIIYKKKSYTGISIHRVGKKIDEGDLFFKKKIYLNDNMNFEEVERLICGKIPEALSFLIDSTLQDKINPICQAQTKSSYYPSFNKTNKQLIWSESFESIQRKLNAMKPMTGLLSMFKNKRVCIWDIKKTEKKNIKNFGKIIDIDDEQKILVCCKNQLLKIESFLRYGKIIKSSNMIKILDIKPGDFFE